MPNLNNYILKKLFHRYRQILFIKSIVNRHIQILTSQLQLFFALIEATCQQSVRENHKTEAFFKLMRLS
ncbi:unnamed protein product [Paramecium octaurelia]|uniref:Uncharacterized protein n=1 Tax=Paramecium octaurelia TaxID=43137 RepID=A0A8S1X281_PAROT|nr:unnamed protein product [Paramecium octaurelia]